MPALNFRQRFAEDIENGWKRQTIRAKRRDGRPHAKPGQTLSLYTGMRTKGCRLLGRVTCTTVRAIEIDQDGAITLDGTQISATDAKRLSLSDGFARHKDFLSFFCDSHGLPFVGVLIEWE